MRRLYSHQTTTNRELTDKSKAIMLVTVKDSKAFSLVGVKFQDCGWMKTGQPTTNLIKRITNECETVQIPKSKFTVFNLHEHRIRVGKKTKRGVANIVYHNLDDEMISKMDFATLERDYGLSVVRDTDLNKNSILVAYRGKNTYDTPFTYINEEYLVFNPNWKDYCIVIELVDE